MKNLHDIIQKNSEELIKLLEKQGVKEDGHDEAAHQIVDEQKHFLLSSQLSIIQAIDEEVERLMFHSPIEKDVLMKYEERNAGLSDLRSFLEEAKGHNNKL